VGAVCGAAVLGHGGVMSPTVAAGVICGDTVHSRATGIGAEIGMTAPHPS